MTKTTAAITAVGKYVPDYILTNKELETMVDTNDEWITSRTGIKERRILKGEGKGTSFMAIKAAEDLLKKSNKNPLDIDLVIVATATPDLPVASTAAYVATEIGATNAFSYDLQAACSSFLYGMSTAASYIESGRYKNILLIGADKMSSIIDYTDRATCIIFGDGAGAALFEPNTEGLGLQDEYLRSDGKGREFLKIDAGGSILRLASNAHTDDNKIEFDALNNGTIYHSIVSNTNSGNTTPVPGNIYYRRHQLAYCITAASIQAVISGIASGVTISGLGWWQSRGVSSVYSPLPNFAIAMCHMSGGTSNTNSSLSTNRSNFTTVLNQSNFDITTTGTAPTVGGLIGTATGTTQLIILDSYALGDIKANDDDKIGGYDKLLEYIENTGYNGTGNSIG